MKIYLADTNLRNFTLLKQCYPEVQEFSFLISYHYWKTSDVAWLVDELKPIKLNLFADSGAYSAMTMGIEINLKQYAEWILRWKEYLTVAANLDVIFDADTTLENQKRLEDMLGFQPLPCFHVNEDWNMLEHYIDNYSYVGLGVGGMGVRKPALFRWLAKCFTFSGDIPIYHGFALTNPTVVEMFPWKSVDSSSWGSGYRYGRLMLFDSTTKQFVSFRLGDRPTLKQARLIASYGFSPSQFSDRTKNARPANAQIMALSFKRFEIWINQRRSSKK